MNKKEILKNFMKRLQAGEKPENLKDEFKASFEDITSGDIAAAEEELVKEGTPLEEIHKLCHVHLAALKETIEKDSEIAPPGHPVHTLMAEHTSLLEFADKLFKTATALKKLPDFESANNEMEAVNHLITHFKESEKHYLREENVLFPSLEKHGITGPPKVMWMEHEQIRELKKKLYPLVENARDLAFEDFAQKFEDYARSLQETLSNHFYKENNILFPASLQALAADEWQEVSEQFDQIGYCCFSPQVAPTTAAVTDDRTETSGGEVIFETGLLPPKVIEAMLNTIPVEITFIDAEDTVRYFSQPEEMLFTRTKAVIGTKVQNCHPQKSLHLVNRILDDFKSGKRNLAEFWIDMKGKKVYIRYFPVRDRNGKYLGCMEVTQDITQIQKIEGQKRLVD